jgi:uncharacterized Rmd1/YagE family protein
MTEYEFQDFIQTLKNVIASQQMQICSLSLDIEESKQTMDSMIQIFLEHTRIQSAMHEHHDTTQDMLLHEIRNLRSDIAYLKSIQSLEREPVLRRIGKLFRASSHSHPDHPTHHRNVV